MNCVRLFLTGLCPSNEVDEDGKPDVYRQCKGANEIDEVPEFKKASQKCTTEGCEEEEQPLQEPVAIAGTNKVGSRKDAEPDTKASKSGHLCVGWIGITHAKVFSGKVINLGICCGEVAHNNSNQINHKSPLLQADGCSADKPNAWAQGRAAKRSVPWSPLCMRLPPKGGDVELCSEILC